MSYAIQHVNGRPGNLQRDDCVAELTAHVKNRIMHAWATVGMDTPDL